MRNLRAIQLDNWIQPQLVGELNMLSISVLRRFPDTAVASDNLEYPPILIFRLVRVSRLMDQMLAIQAIITI